MDILYCYHSVACKEKFIKYHEITFERPILHESHVKIISPSNTLSLSFLNGKHVLSMSHRIFCDNVSIAQLNFVHISALLSIWGELVWCYLHNFGPSCNISICLHSSGNRFLKRLHKRIYGAFPNLFFIAFRGLRSTFS